MFSIVIIQLTLYILRVIEPFGGSFILLVIEPQVLGDRMIEEFYELIHSGCCFQEISDDLNLSLGLLVIALDS